ncbi:hypothetical protein ACFO1B_02655 [Dactylosporangium siamense]|uniref:hypothetical protein n=1 Tax=Dactylosporangium siamense TaxID=685454 RepID=UPI001943E182|nr:hypothetical protein [Dactylosporangium siamense]
MRPGFRPYREWLAPGFWESYFDGDPAAAGDYRRELNTILDAHRAHGPDEA